MSQYYTLLTEIGQAKLANAISLAQPFSITDLAVGDGGGATPDLDASATALVNEQRRAAVNRVETDADNSNWLIVEQVLPPDVGGFTIREAGVYDADGDLIAIGSYPATYKPQLAEGASRTQTIRFVMMVSDTSAITLKVDPSVVLATRGYVDGKLATQPQAEAGTDNTRFSSPLRVFQAIKKLLGRTKDGRYGIDITGSAEEAANASKLDGKPSSRYLNTDAYGNSFAVSLYSKGINLDSLTGLGFYYQSDDGYADTSLNYPLSRHGGLLTFKSGGAQSTTQLYSANDGDQLFFRGSSASAQFNAWRFVRDSGNTTVDNNGYVKESSPVVRLYLDRIEPNQDIGAVLAKQALGVYRIDGTPGLAREGWQIETPRDANGQILLYVTLAERDDHTIDVHTYQPVWADGVAGPGAPVDIPEGRWFDLRLAEPEPATDNEANA